MKTSGGRLVRDMTWAELLTWKAAMCLSDDHPVWEIVSRVWWYRYEAPAEEGLDNE
jgi:hypothetical protein